MRIALSGIALLVCLLQAAPAGALRIDFTALPALAAGNDRIFTVDLETGTVRFGDGVHGAVPPVGGGPGIAAYDVGAGAIGNVIPIAEDPSADSPFLIPLDEFPVSNQDDPEISFILFGIEALEFEVSERGLGVTDVRPVPGVPAFALLALGAIGLFALAWRRRRS